MSEASTERLLGELGAHVANIREDMVKINDRLTTIATDVEDLKEDKWMSKGAVWFGRTLLIAISSIGTLLVTKGTAILAAMGK